MTLDELMKSAHSKPSEDPKAFQAEIEYELDNLFETVREINDRKLIERFLRFSTRLLEVHEGVLKVLEYKKDRYAVYFMNRLSYLALVWFALYGMISLFISLYHWIKSLFI